LVREFVSLYGLRACILRVFSAYGIGLRRQVMWDVCLKALGQDTVELIGTGAETRDFVHVKDICNAIVLALKKAPMAGEVYNVGSGVETAIGELAEMLAGALDRPVRFTFSNTVRQGDPIRWRADIEKLKHLGYRPSVSLASGLGEYALWARSQAAEC
jgi:UDP-glucose 4-epimerase